MGRALGPLVRSATRGLCPLPPASIAHGFSAAQSIIDHDGNRGRRDGIRALSGRQPCQADRLWHSNSKQKGRNALPKWGSDGTNRKIGSLGFALPHPVRSIAKWMETAGGLSVPCRKGTW